MLSVWSVCAASEPERQQREKTARHPGQDGVPTVTEPKSHVKGRSWDRLASQDLSPSVSQGTIWRYVAVDRRLGYA